MNDILSVSEITKYIKDLVSRDQTLSDVWVKGEISNFKLHSAGHMYFTLKDDGAVLKSVMFRGYTSVLRFFPEDGMNVILHGYISVFEKNGQYQLYVTKMEPDGIGGLHLAFRQLQEKLRKEGLFDEEIKKELPYIPDTVCVVTSPTGSVIRDITNVLFRRFPNIHMRVLPVAVQGEQAGAQIAHALKVINDRKLGDVVILARGGGSLEDLWPFNEEVVARAIHASSIPVISAVGHETDFTIADFVADKRAPTPSAAAELVVPEKLLLKEQLGRVDRRLNRALMRQLEFKKQRLKTLNGSVVFKQPYNRVYQERMKLDIQIRTLTAEMKAHFQASEKRFDLALNKLEMVNPLKILSRGYTTVNSLIDGELIKSVTTLASGDRVRITMQDGKADCTVNAIKEENVYGKG